METYLYHTWVSEIYQILGIKSRAGKLEERPGAGKVLQTALNLQKDFLTTVLSANPPRLTIGDQVIHWTPITSVGRPWPRPGPSCRSR